MPKAFKNRKTVCLRGHPRTPENLSYRQGCLICQKAARLRWTLRARGYFETVETAVLPVDWEEAHETRETLTQSAGRNRGQD